MTGDKPIEIHLCEEHANEYLHKSGGSIADFDPAQGNLAEQVKKKVSTLQQTTRELIEMEMRTCPICDSSLQDFRKTGRLGCPNDYLFFDEQLEPLLMGIHGSTEHVGKKPSRAGAADNRNLLIRLRRELDAAVSVEDYELAGKLRDRIRGLES
jgi:protein arginine kinase activator